jgi:cysteinyl-tRNA synthetase
MPEASEAARELAARRAAARRERDFATADALRDELASLGFRMVDRPDGYDLEPIEPDVARRIAPRDVPSVLDAPPDLDVTVQWVVQGWAEDVARGIASFVAHAPPGLRVEHVVVDGSGADPGVFPEGAEVLCIEGDPGWGALRTAALRRSRGAVVLLVDGSVEATGDAITPLVRALDDPTVGVAGPFGIVSDDLREFREDAGPDVDAIEGYLLAVRREVLVDAGGFDERFRFYRTADIDLSFRIRDRGLRALVVDVPVTRHEHRGWHRTPEAERDAASKRNFYRFLERFRGRTDLLVRGGGTPGSAG